MHPSETFIMDFNNIHYRKESSLKDVFYPVYSLLFRWKNEVRVELMDWSFVPLVCSGEKMTCHHCMKTLVLCI